MADQSASSRRFRERLKLDPVRYAAFRAKESARKQRLRAIPGYRRAHEPGRARPSAEPPPIGPLQHPLLEAARAAVASPRPGVALRFADELDVEDARSEYVLALLERRDPSAAARDYLSRARAWDRLTEPLDA